MSPQLDREGEEGKSILVRGEFSFHSDSAIGKAKQGRDEEKEEEEDGEETLSLRRGCQLVNVVRIFPKRWTNTTYNIQGEVQVGRRAGELTKGMIRAEYVGKLRERI